MGVRLQRNSARFLGFRNNAGVEESLVQRVKGNQKGDLWSPRNQATIEPGISTIDVVIPALNEEESLPLVLGALPDEWIRKIVVVDNGSTDRTADVAKKMGASVVEEFRRGYGSACLRGIAELAKNPPDIVVFIDADFSDEPQELPHLVAPIICDDVDLVIGSRTIGTRERGALLPQAIIGNRLACLLIDLMYGYQFTDLGPFRAISWAALTSLGMKDRDFGWTVEMQIKAARRGLATVEVPVSYRKRIGVSKITGTISGTVRAGHKILSTLAREYIDQLWTEAKR